MGLLRRSQHLLDEKIFVLGLNCSLHEQLKQFLDLLRVAASADLHQIDLLPFDLHPQDVTPESLNGLKEHLEVGELMRESPRHVHHLTDANEVLDDLREFQQENPIRKLR